MGTVTEPTLNEILHIAGLAHSWLESIGPDDEDQPTDWEWAAVNKITEWAHALEKFGPASEIKLAIAVLAKHNELWWVVKSLEPYSIEGVYTISTAHITQETAEALNGGNNFDLIVNDKGQAGWWIYVADHASWAKVPGDLKQCLKAAKALGCPWLCLDQDAAQVDGLEVWDW
ncbi:DUF5983 family protein [Brucella intermedia]|uniref:DUF5983 family protein n=1 Tax=Brucella intermedia TaxID=94625 RepID=UPI00224B7218|nr:hypothetical protein [Brucella intermedia]